VYLFLEIDSRLPACRQAGAGMTDERVGISISIFRYLTRLVSEFYAFLTWLDLSVI